MRLEVNVRHVEHVPVRLRGKLEIGALDLDPRDDLVQFRGPLSYSLEVERLGEGLVIQGKLELPLHCTCVRCLRPFERTLVLDPWACHLPLSGEGAAIVSQDVVDLTPSVREDILLALPQHPLCESECRGLSSEPRGKVPRAVPDGPKEPDASVWAELDKLKF